MSSYINNFLKGRFHINIKPVTKSSANELEISVHKLTALKQIYQVAALFFERKKK